MGISWRLSVFQTESREEGAGLWVMLLFIRVTNLLAEWATFSVECHDTQWEAGARWTVEGVKDRGDCRCRLLLTDGTKKQLREPR